MASDSVSAPIRRLFSVSCLSNASCTLLARLVAQLLARCVVLAPLMNVDVTNPLGCDAMCSLSAMQVRHGHSKCSHLEGAARIMMTEGGPRAHWRVRAQRVFGAARSGRQVGEWTDISPCREFISQCTKSFNMTGEDMCHDTVSHEV